MPRLYIYVVRRDFGFAPNPFHGICTLATCKPEVRSTARVGDWVVGVGGRDLKATGRLIFAMEVTGALAFCDYWSDPRFRDKRPVRNGSKTMMVGDNIYHRSDVDGRWLQEDSHHSDSDGQPDPVNILKDTQTDRVLFSEKFIYFGRDATAIPEGVLKAVGYKNGRGHRVFEDPKLKVFLSWLLSEYKSEMGSVVGLPFQFEHSGARFSFKTSKITF